ncbi:helix-turn-helix domain-containing protein [Nocardia sp. NPDC057030]|uniref:helix-turn-helix domain-containing protein n=1 Tax=unclassified Nocardia TaxID=2637762 RepID=UPI0036381C24
MHSTADPCPPALPVGARIELRRIQRRMSRRAVAHRVGRSEEWLRLIESGRRRLDSVQIIVQLAEVLLIDDVTELIDVPARAVPHSTDAVERVLAPLTRVLLDYPALEIYAVADQRATVSAVRAELRRCQEIWACSPQRYSALGERLPAVVWSCRVLRWQSAQADSAELLVHAYHLAVQLLMKIGAHRLAAVVADRAMGVAGDLGIPLLLAASSRQLADALLQLEKYDECRDHAVAAVARLAKQLPGSVDGAAVTCALYLLAAKAAHAQDDLADADRFLALAQQARALPQPRAGAGQPSGATELGLARMENALRHNDFDEIIRIGAAHEPTEREPVGDRARYHIVLAYSFVRRGQDVAAAFALDKAAAACPEDLRYDPEARQALQYLLRNDNQLIRPDVARLAGLAAFD